MGLVWWVTSDPGGSEVFISSWSSGSRWGDPGGPAPARLHISPKLMSSDPKYALKRRIVERRSPPPARAAHLTADESEPAVLRQHHPNPPGGSTSSRCLETTPPPPESGLGLSPTVPPTAGEVWETSLKVTAKVRQTNQRAPFWAQTLLPPRASPGRFY